MCDLTPHAVPKPKQTTFRQRVATENTQPKPKKTLRSLYMPMPMPIPVANARAFFLSYYHVTSILCSFYFTSFRFGSVSSISILLPPCFTYLVPQSIFVYYYVSLSHSFLISPHRIGTYAFENNITRRKELGGFQKIRIEQKIKLKTF